MLIEDEIRVDMKQLIADLRSATERLELNTTPLTKREVNKIEKSVKRNLTCAKPRPVDVPSKIRKLFRSK